MAMATNPKPLVTITTSANATTPPVISMHNQNMVGINPYQAVGSPPQYYVYRPYPPMQFVQPWTDMNELPNTEPPDVKIDVDEIKRLVHKIAMIGLTVALFIASLIIGIMSLIFSLQPSVPTGTIFPYSGSAVDLLRNDNQWLFCDGSAVSRTKYSALFLVIGTAYGAGDGSDTFNLPDLRSRFLWGSSGVNETTLVSGGNATHTLTVAQLPVHSHDSGTLATVTNGVHSHTYTQTPHNHGGVTGNAAHPGSSVLVASGFSYWVYNGATSASHTITGDNANIAIQNAGSHTHTIIGATETEGKSESFSKMPPYQTVHYIIRI